jgi:hypothetical protein
MQKNNIFKKFISCNKGQIAIPALLIIPTLLLFVYLLFETTKISREKIRHQFALDSALFAELTNHAHYLNRTAYVNGAFPHRIFKEAFDCPPEENRIDRSDPDPDVDYECLYDVLYEMGAYPTMTNDEGGTANDRLNVWKFKYAKRRIEEDDYADLNNRDPDFPYQFELLQLEKAKKLWLRKSTMEIIARIYYQIYNLLGDVQKSQRSIYERLVANATFLRKAFFWNAGSCTAGMCGQEAAAAILPYKLKTDLKYIDQTVHFIKGDEIDPDELAFRTFKMRNKYPDPGLFQLAIVKGNFSRLARGITVYQSFYLGDNYFNINLNSLFPRVRSTVAITHPIGRDLQRAVWPDSTPKFAVRLSP